jgi:SAM-dependent methyltransferase
MEYALRRKLTREFKLEPVRQAAMSEKSRAQLARELGDSSSQSTGDSALRPGLPLLVIASRLALALAALVLALPGAAQVKPEAGDEVYQPTPGQAGKDVVWIPTPDALVIKMLDAVKTNKDDLVYDLGSGDGKIPIAAAKEYGARAVGIEYNPEMAELARRNVKREGVDRLVSIITGDIFAEDFSKATVVTMYLLPQLNIKLRPTILKMKPGTRVTSHQFDMGEWEPDQQLKVETRDAYVWIVPANVDGRWALRDDRGSFSGTLNLVQRYQRLGGTLVLGGKTRQLLSAWIEGDNLGFSFIDSDNNLLSARMRVAGSAMTGVLSDGRKTPLTASRR